MKYNSGLKKQIFDNLRLTIHDIHDALSKCIL